MSLSCRGRIDHSSPPDPEKVCAVRNGLIRDAGKFGWPDPDHGSPRAKLKRYLYIRNILFVLEIIHSAFYGYACWSPAVTDQLSKCEAYSGPLSFARAVVVTWWIVLIIYTVGWLIYVDPVGLCTPGLLDELEIFDKIDHIEDPTEFNLFKFHRASLETSHIRRRLQTICCCLGLRGHQSRGVALQDAASAFHTIFKDVDLVGSDLVAGLILLNLDQKQKVRSGQCLVEEHKQLTFEKMGDKLIPPGYKLVHCDQSRVPLNFEDIDEYLLFEDVIHFFHYALGVYGWPLFVYGHLMTGCCTLAQKTCCRCYCCRLRHKRREEEIVADDGCFCGFASVQLQSPQQSLRNSDVTHVSFENDYFQAPFLLCVDHERHSIVLCVRGTLSFKDVLTDMTLSSKELSIPGVEEAYVHNGLHETAEWILNKLLHHRKPILRTVCQKHPLYKLVIVGHSLGAGVASVLALLLRPQFPDTVCYAFSPPGCVFSFPLAVYTREFITSVVIGNDIIPRLSFRSLHYMKREIEHLLKGCNKPKHQVLLQPRACDKCCGIVCCHSTENPTVKMEDFKDKLFQESNYSQETVGQDETDCSVPNIPMVTKAPSILKWDMKNRSEETTGVHTLVKKVKTPEPIPRFPPGRILHVRTDEKQKSCFLANCYQRVFDISWMNSEDLGVIVADRGMLEDHLPTSVMGTLKACRRQVLASLDKPHSQEAIDRRRLELSHYTTRSLIEGRDIQFRRGLEESFL